MPQRRVSKPTARLPTNKEMFDNRCRPVKPWWDNVESPKNTTKDLGHTPCCWLEVAPSADPAVLRIVNGADIGFFAIVVIIVERKVLELVL
jgi:hypothetical protein